MTSPTYYRLHGGPYDGRDVTADMARGGRITPVARTGDARDLRNGPIPTRLAHYDCLHSGVALFANWDDELKPGGPNVFRGKNDDEILAMIIAAHQP